MTSGFLGIALHFIRSTFRHKKEGAGAPARPANSKPVSAIRKASSKVTFTGIGPDGDGRYEGPEGSLSLYWQFGINDVLVIISVPTPEEWTAQTNIPLADRLPILHFIGSEAIRQNNAGRGRVEVTDNSILIRS